MAFKVGDKVVSPYGVGEVVNIIVNTLVVKIKGLSFFYNENGRSSKPELLDEFPTLFKLGEQPDSWKVTKTVKKYRVLHRSFKGIRSLKLSTGYYESLEEFSAQMPDLEGIQLLVDEQDFEEVEILL